MKIDVFAHVLPPRYLEERDRMFYCDTVVQGNTPALRGDPAEDLRRRCP